MNRITDEIKRLADEELAWAIKNYGYFHSLHEGNGKLMEELDEAKSEIEIAEILMDDLWDRVKCGDDERAVDYAKDIAKRAILASAELVQVSAVAQKIVESESEDGKKYWKKIELLMKEMEKSR